MTKNQEPPFPPVASRRSAAIAAPTTNQPNPYPGLRTIRGDNSIHGTPPTRQRPISEDEEQDYPEPPKRARTSSISRAAKPTRRLPQTRFHWLIFVGIGLFIMIIGWLSFSALSSWWSVQQDDWHYGRPRTFQTDQVVGHADSASHPSHFIAVNLNGQILVIELPGGDASHAHIYIGPHLFGNGEDLAAVTLSFEDRNGDGKPDLNIHIEGSDQVIVFLNDGKEFVSPQQH